MLIVYSFFNFFTVLSRNSKTEAQTTTLTVCIEKIIRVEVSYEQMIK